ncbi:MAG: tyrosine-type recombinase/integrase [Chloroflexi bacterium]|nr:tyrosine-type recombinase/integrase [Chloroflexota bacterium]
MPKLKLTKTAIDRIKQVPGKQTLHWDTELTGFGVLVSGKTKAKTFIVQRDVKGKARRITIAPTNVLSLDDAREQAKLVLADMYRRIDPKAEWKAEQTKQEAEQAKSLTLAAALDSYLAVRKDLRPASITTYHATIHRYLAEWLDKPLRDITPDMVEDRLRSIKEEVEARGQSHMATGGATANATMRTLRILWYHASEGISGLPDNPVKRLSKRKAWYPDPTRENMVKDSDLPRFYEAITKLPNPMHFDYLCLLLFTGLRRSEAATLRWDDIDLTERMIHLPAEITKTAKKLDLPMSDYLHDLFTARRAIGRDGPFVFPADSKSGHIEELRFALGAVLEGTGIKVALHDLRRTFVTVAESCDIPVYALKGLVNHSMGKDQTADYIKPGPDYLREPMQKVTDRFKELIGLTGLEGDNVAKLRPGA